MWCVTVSLGVPQITYTDLLLDYHHYSIVIIIIIIIIIIILENILN